MIFYQLEGIYVNVVNPDNFFDSLRDIAMATSFWKNCRMTFIQHLGILKQSGISQYG